jgi:DNA-binding MarR family transcriptional regulator
VSVVPDPSLGVLLFIPYREMEARIVQRVQDAGHSVTIAQARLVARLDPGGSRPSRLAEAAGVTKQTAGYLIDQVEQAGLVERVPDPCDGRARLIRITTAGEEVVRIARQEERRVEREWRRHLGADDLEQLRGLLLRLREITDPYLD